MKYLALLLPILYLTFFIGDAHIFSPNLAETFLPAPNNDDCADARAIPVANDGSCILVNGNNNGATASGETPNPACGTFGNGKDVWFKVTVPYSGKLRLEMAPRNPLSDPSDWVMQAYSGSCGNLSRIRCRDDNGPNISSGFPRMSLENRTPGEEILIRIFEDGNNAQGRFSLCAYALCDEPTVNFSTRQDCSNNRFYVDVEVTDMGTEQTLSISSSGILIQVVTAPGTYSIGPFSSGSVVNLNGLTGPNPTCSISSGPLTLSCSDGDFCYSAKALVMQNSPNCQTRLSGTTVGATASGEQPTISCLSGMGEDRWYKTIVPATGAFIVELNDTGEDTDLGMQLYTGSCGNLTELGNCKNTPTGGGGSVKITGGGLAPNSTVYIRVYDYGLPGPGAFSICAHAITPKTNDFCSTATSLSVNTDNTCTQEQTLDLSGALNSGDAGTPDCGLNSRDNVDADLWFKVDVPSSRNITLRANSVSGSSISSLKVQVYRGSCGNLIKLECAELTTSGSKQIRLNNRTPGETLYIRAFVGRLDAVGPIKLCAYSCSPPSATFSVRPDCNNLQFYVDAQITALGSATSLTYKDNKGNEIKNITSAGTYSIGPYNSPASVTATVAPNNVLCEIKSTLSFACNDDCTGAYSIPVNTDGSCTQTQSLNSQHLTPSGASPNPNCSGLDFYVGFDHWYQVTVPATGALNLKVIDNGSGSNLETWGMQVYRGSCMNLTRVQCATSPKFSTDKSKLPSIDLIGRTPGEVLWIRVFNNPNYPDSYAGTAQLCADDLSTVLPLELLYFDAVSSSEGNRLDWQTSQEENTYRFVIERLENKRTIWQEIGEVTAAGFSVDIRHYEYLDESPPLLAYYRLRMEDLDGSFTYSPIQVVEHQGDQTPAATLVVFPNPAGQQLNIKLQTSEEGSGQLEILGLDGRVLQSTTVSVGKGLQIIPLSIGTLPAGLYILRLQLRGRNLMTRFVRE